MREAHLTGAEWYTSSMAHDVSEGDWFAVPLRTDGFAVGVVARAGTGGVLLGYFFGPRRQAQAGIDDVRHLRPEQAVLVGRFGHLGLTGGTWPLLGRAPCQDVTAPAAVDTQ